MNTKYKYNQEHNLSKEESQGSDKKRDSEGIKRISDNATYIHAISESFKSGAIKTAEETEGCAEWVGIAVATCAMVAMLPLLLLLAKFAPLVVVFICCGFIPLIGIGLAFLTRDITRYIGGIINGIRTVFNKKMHEIQKRREASTSPLVVKKEDIQPPLWKSAKPKNHICISEHRFGKHSFWSKLPPKYQPSAPPVEEPGSLNNGLR